MEQAKAGYQGTVTIGIEVAVGPPKVWAASVVDFFQDLSWRIPWTEEPGGLQSMGSETVRHN